jgi:UDP-2,3-diacylglucosamine pyrophosphatase LpxH
MISIDNLKSVPTSLLRIARFLVRLQQVFAHRRLTQLYRHAKVIPFDDSSKFVFFSDLHRGDKTRTDEFSQNEPMFLWAMRRYFDQGFTYIEVGDGDDLWCQRSFQRIRQMYEQVFEMIHQFDRRGRLYFILGNHEIIGRRRDSLEKDGIPAHEALVLEHRRTKQRLFIFHGHQADYMNDRFILISRLMVRYVWRRINASGIARYLSRFGRSRGSRRIRNRIMDWIRRGGPVVICGHTHQATSPEKGSVPYFNLGACHNPGFLTGIEISDGKISLVKWLTDQVLSPPAQPSYQRVPISPPTELSSLRSRRR